MNIRQLQTLIAIIEDFRDGILLSKSDVGILVNFVQSVLVPDEHLESIVLGNLEATRRLLADIDSVN